MGRRAITKPGFPCDEGLGVDSGGDGKKVFDQDGPKGVLCF